MPRLITTGLSVRSTPQLGRAWNPLLRRAAGDLPGRTWVRRRDLHREPVPMSRRARQKRRESPQGAAPVPISAVRALRTLPGAHRRGRGPLRGSEGTSGPPLHRRWTTDQAGQRSGQALRVVDRPAPPSRARQLRGSPQVWSTRPNGSGRQEPQRPRNVDRVMTAPQPVQRVPSSGTWSMTSWRGRARCAATRHRVEQ